jgi:aminoglycoside phosphotransferase (APT) family kinase protein
MTSGNETSGDSPKVLDLRETLERWLCDRISGSGPVRVGQLSKPGAGLSAGTLLFEATRGDGGREVTHELVVRMPPPKERALFPDGDLARELEIQNLLSTSGVPVAPVVGLETDPALIGGPFLVTRRVKGRLVDSNDPYMSVGWLHDSSPEFQHELAIGYMTVLADIHKVPIEELRGTGLDQPKKIGLGAALDRWSSYLNWADDDAAPDSLYEALEWCQENRPTLEPPDVLVWGDAQLANAVFDDDGQTAAVLDFELSAIGPAELDLGWFFCLHDMTVARCGEDLAGFADRSGLLNHYEERLGRQVADLAWYEIFAAVCTASILVRMSKLMSQGGVDLRWLARTNPALDYLSSRVN